MDLNQEIKRLEHEVESLKAAFSQSGTNVFFTYLSLVPRGELYNAIAYFETIDGGPTLAFSGQSDRRLPSSNGARFRGEIPVEIVPEMTIGVISLKGAKT